MSDDTLIKVEGASKKFCRSLKRSLWYGIQDLGKEIRGHRHGGDGALRPDEFWAVKDVSFELKRGECLGLIGRNGAGKTTLLRMLNGLIKPDAGRIEMRGRIGALIALGAGFNPILTGRENIYVNASVLGLTKSEIKAKLDEIIDFAEIGEFIDSPVQSYSSGMAVRLGFAVASSLEPDILILDEVLAVGDVGFRLKCYNRIYGLANRAAVIFVSHSMPQVARLANRVNVMAGGETSFSGDVSKAIDVYESSFSKCRESNWEISSGFSVDYVAINGRSNQAEVFVQAGASLHVEVRLRLPPRSISLEAVLNIHSPSYELISHINSSQSGLNLIACAASSQSLITISVPSLTLGSGRKLLSLILRDSNTKETVFWAETAWVLNVTSSHYIPAPVYHEATFSIVECS